MKGIGPKDPRKNSMADVPLFQTIEPQCRSCAHLRPEGNCKAFVNGIPVQIWVNNFDHTKPYPGDNGIRYKAKP